MCGQFFLLLKHDDSMCTLGGLYLDWIIKIVMALYDKLLT